MKRRGILFCLVGPAGSGKTTFATRLLEAHPETLSLSISVTSRAPRSGEQQGVSYHFVSVEEFKAKIEAKEFFEWEETHGNFYGTPASTVHDCMHSGVDLLLDVDIRGALNFKRTFPENTVICFVVPASSAALKSRIKARSNISEEELVTRMATARREYSRLLELAEARDEEIGYVVVNDALEDAYAQVAAILAAERARLIRLDLEGLRSLCIIED